MPNNLLWYRLDLLELMYLRIGFPKNTVNYTVPNAFTNSSQ